MSLTTVYNNYLISKENKEMFSFKSKHTYENRVTESNNIKCKYPDRIPVIVEKQQTSDITVIDKNKFLVPNDLTVGQFVYVIRKRMKMPPEKAIFVFVNNQIPLQSSLMSSVYDEYKDKDGFLYMLYASENTFGV